jgi:hypothetical protein
MTNGLFLALLAISFACCIAAYRITASERGWPMGSIYFTDKPIFISQSCIVLSILRIIFGAAHHHFGWWTMLLIPLAWIPCSPLLINLLKEKTGPIALIGAPIAVIASDFFK